jgi:adenosylmethionine-8-amino-7-oxononanoate aminotransferase
VIETADGERYLDAVGGVYVVNIGHGVAEVADAMREQAATLAFPYGGAFTTRAELDLAKEAMRRAPKGMAAAYFVSGGSEANEVAIKLARKYQLVKGRPQRWRIVSRWQSYHGATMATLSATGYTARRRDFEPYMLDFPHIPAPHCYRCPLNLTHPECALACADALETTLCQEGDTIAAFICEPIIGAAAGAVVPPAGYYERIRAICEEHDILFIADEVITAYGRTGAEFAVDHYGITPDLITCAKGMSGGYAPLGAVLLHERVCNTLEESEAASIFTGYTYSAHPVSCAAGLAVLKYIREHDLVGRARDEGAWLLEQLKQRVGDCPSVGDIRGKGLLIGIEFVRDRDSRAAFEPAGAFAREIVERAWQQHVILRSDTGTVDGIAGDHLLLAPPLTIERPELETIVEVIARSINETEAEFGLR